MGFLVHRRTCRGLIVFGGILAFFALAGGCFLLRAPVVLVEDAPFTALYGPGRGLRKQAELAFRLFRPVKTVNVAENSGPDMVVFAVEESAKIPHAVLFPYRYYEGAQRYVEKYPGLPVMVAGSRSSPSSPAPSKGPFFVTVDTETDYYRAGLAAAVFVQSKPGKLLVFQNGPVTPVIRRALSEGLRVGGCEEQPLFLENGGDYTLWQDVSCVILDGQVADFLDRNLKIPVILFSWIDPALTPMPVMIVFDNSSWALAPKIFGKGEEDRPPVSETVVLSERVGNREMTRVLKQALKQSRQVQ